MGTTCVPKQLKVRIISLTNYAKYYSNQLNFLTLIMNQRDYKK